MKLMTLSGGALCKETVRCPIENRKPVSKHLLNLNLGNLMPICGLHGSVLKWEILNCCGDREISHCQENLEKGLGYLSFIFISVDSHSPIKKPH